MTEYRVTWEIDIKADTFREAALLALEIQRDPTSIATVFDVIAPDGRIIQVDLDDGASDTDCPECGSGRIRKRETPIGTSWQCESCGTVQGGSDD